MKSYRWLFLFKNVRSDIQTLNELNSTLDWVSKLILTTNTDLFIHLVSKLCYFVSKTLNWNWKRSLKFSRNLKISSCWNVYKDIFFYFFSLAVHPNKLLIATGQATGHDRREGKVSNLWFCYKRYILFLQKWFLSF